jgi:hypothetical protein
MRIISRSSLLGALALVVAGCDDTLTVEPVTEVAETQAITDAVSARSALAGMYDALQSDEDDYTYYAGSYLFFTELASDNSEHTGTFASYGDVDAHDARADNGEVEAVWEILYKSIGRANTIIAKVPNVTQLSEEERSDMIGQAHLVRALGYHNLVRMFGGVPIRTTPPADLAELSEAERASVDQVYDQVLSDLDQAAQLMSDEFRTTRGSLGAVEAIRSRVLLYRQSWAGAEAAADAVLGMGYELAENFPDLFDPEGQDTPEDIWKVSFTAVEYSLHGYYYLDQEEGGRREVAPTEDLAAAYDPEDVRFQWTIARASDDNLYGAKFPTPIGAEDVHVIRLGEVLLNKAEAQARLGKLPEAVDTYNLLRERAGIPAHVYGTDVTTAEEVLDAIWLERRRELALEGDRFFDLVRTGRATTVLGIPETRTLFPIPQNEIDVAPKLTQNPGY